MTCRIAASIFFCASTSNFCCYWQRKIESGIRQTKISTNGKSAVCQHCELKYTNYIIFPTIPSSCCYGNSSLCKWRSLRTFVTYQVRFQELLELVNTSVIKIYKSSNIEKTIIYRSRYYDITEIICKLC